MNALLLTSMMAAQADMLIAPSDVVGVELQRMTPRLRRYLDAPAGVLITEVRPHSLAAQADLRSGDVLMQLDHTTLHSPAQVNIVLSVNQGEEVSLLLFRDGYLMRMDVDVPYETWSVEEDEPDPVDIFVHQWEELEERDEEIAELQAQIEALEEALEED